MTTLYCLGDSLTFGPGVRASQKWTALASSESMKLINLGVPGDTTAGMLARLQSLTAQPVYHLPPDERPFVLVMGGTNDIFFAGSDLTARSCISACVHQLSAAGYRPLVGIPLPVSVKDAPKKWADLADFAASARALEDYCLWLKAFCKAFDIPVVDFRQDYVNQGAVRRDLLPDGLHPNAEGHQLMAARLLETIK